ncbi:integrin alpha-9-like [Diprion similis]|uniref:integrin alpha-9-like n=1 Tax=Diprion similis TaxID=362088 RepID=UPI001EF7CC15|nr:integrin alpha-9-like [Diprion similis]
MIPSGRFYRFGCTLANVLTLIVAHQFDVDNAILYENPTTVTNNSRTSYFGYTVALWNRNSQPWLFIGAPRASSSLYKTTGETGTVFKCHIGKQCMEWPIDKQEDKSQQPQKGSWLGGAMIVQNNKRPSLWVCAPNWMDYSNNDVSSVPMHGRCYRVSADKINSQEPQGLSIELLNNPLNTYIDPKGRSFNFHRLAQCGFSLNIAHSKSSHRLISGCPGVYGAHGTSVIQENNKLAFIVLQAKGDLGGSSDQFGYAVTSGKYFGDGEHIDARGGPRGSRMLGQVRLFQFPSKADENDKPREDIQIDGTQIGEYFGAALASCDIDADGKDDLLVGAPHWSTNIKELGRIYIYREGYGTVRVLEDCSTNMRNYGFKKREHIAGKIDGGRYGTTITCLGDINHDGFADVAVGAPYSENGIVDIYYGSKNGLDLNHKRTITGPENTKGFGFSISEAVDIDNNGYVDIAIGAYLSGHVMLVRSNRIVNLNVKLSSNVTRTSGLRQRAQFLSLTVCSWYEGANKSQNITVTTELKIDDEYQRATFSDKTIDSINKTVYKFDTILKADQKWCNNYIVNIIKKPDYFLYPLKFSVRQNLTKHESQTGLLKVRKNGAFTSKDNFCESCAVMNEFQEPPEDHLEVPFALECNNREFCSSSLSINVVTNWNDTKPYVIGSSEVIELDVTVKNDGERAYFTKVNISMPSCIQLHNSGPLICEEVENVHEIRKVTCNISDSLDHDETQSVKVSLDAAMMPTDLDKITLNATAVTFSNDTKLGNYTASLSISCVVKAAIGIAGASEETLYPYTLSGPAEDLPNIRFRHTFGIRNDEITPIEQALVSVSVPTHWVASGNEDVEIVRLNETRGGISKPGEDMDTKILLQVTDVEALSSNAIMMSEWLPDKESSKTETDFAKVNGQVFAASAENRTLFMNCTNPAFKCTTVSFELGPLKQSTATLDLVLDIFFSNIKPDIIGKKDIIFFVTNASTKILQPNTRLIANMNPVSMMVATKFVGSPQDQHVAAWVIVTSSSVGLILLVLLVLALVKLGFFKRTKKTKLEALKRQSGACPKLVLETTSSTEVLDKPYYISN